MRSSIFTNYVYEKTNMNDRTLQLQHTCIYMKWLIYCLLGPKNLAYIIYRYVYFVYTVIAENVAT